MAMQESSQELRLAMDHQLTFEWYCICFINNNNNVQRLLLYIIKAIAW